MLLLPELSSNTTWYLVLHILAHHLVELRRGTATIVHSWLPILILLVQGEIWGHHVATTATNHRVHGLRVALWRSTLYLLHVRLLWRIVYEVGLLAHIFILRLHEVIVKLLAIVLLAWCGLTWSNKLYLITTWDSIMLLFLFLRVLLVGILWVFFSAATIWRISDVAFALFIELVRCVCCFCKIVIRRNVWLIESGVNHLQAWNFAILVIFLVSYEISKIALTFFRSHSWILNRLVDAVRSLEARVYLQFIISLFVLKWGCIWTIWIKLGLICISLFY